MVVRIKVPGAALAGKNIVLTGKGVTRIAGANNHQFDRCPYEVVEQQGVLPSVVKAGSPDFVDVFIDKDADNNPVSPEMDLSGVYQVETVGGVEVVDVVNGNNLWRLRKVEFVRNAGV